MITEAAAKMNNTEREPHALQHQIKRQQKMIRGLYFSVTVIATHKSIIGDTTQVSVEVNCELMLCCACYPAKRPRFVDYESSMALANAWGLKFNIKFNLSGCV